MSENLNALAVDVATAEHRLMQAIDRERDNGMAWVDISHATGIYESDLRLRWAVYIGMTVTPRKV